VGLDCKSLSVDHSLAASATLQGDAAAGTGEVFMGGVYEPKQLRLVFSKKVNPHRVKLAAELVVDEANNSAVRAHLFLFSCV